MRWILLLLPYCLLACGDKKPAPTRESHEHGHDHEEDHDHAHDHDEDAGDEDDHAHTHPPRYGGSLVVVGEYAAQVEVVHEPETGKVTAYIWDGCIEHPVRSDMKAIRLTANTGEKDFHFDLLPLADPLTGEKEGDSARFVGVSDRLKGVKTFDGILGEVSLLGKTFPSKAFIHGEPSDGDVEE